MTSASYDHLHPSLIETVQLPAEDRIRFIKKQRWIGYSRAQDILAKLDDLVHHPRQARMPNMVLIGSSNSGKTRILEHFANRYPADENVGGEHIIAPVVLIEAPPTPSESALYGEILSALFKKVPSGSTDVIRRQAVKVLREIQLKVLVIDELHNMLAGATVKQQGFLNVIKYLGNTLKISIVGAGTGDLLRAMSIDPQIQNRFTPELIQKWVKGKEFLKLLKSFESTLPLREPSNLSGTILAAKLLAMSEGILGELSTLINTAAIFSIQNGIEKITPEVLNSCGYVPPSNRTEAASRA